MAEKKSLTLTKTKLADTEGEHRIIFVASTSTTDRVGEKVAIGTFRLPTRGGGQVIVKDLPDEGADNIDIPLLLNHDLGKVEDTIGSVRKAYYANDELIFDVGISSRPLAQDMFTLVEEKHLDNAFSIQFRDYERDLQTNTLYGGEILEVSLVARACNTDAQVLAVKSLENEEREEQVEETTETPIVDEPVNETPAVEETVEETETEVETPAVEETEAKSEVAEEATEEIAEESEAEEAEAEVETNNNSNEEKEMNEDVAKSLVKEATQTKTVATDYLSSKSAMADFARIIKEEGANAEKAWIKNLEAKGVTGDAILPSEIESIFFKAWEDNPSVIATFGNVRLNSGAVYAFTTESRALGHKKGEAKADQTLTTVRRDIKAKIIYKKLPIDLQDLIDDTTGELLRFRVRELADRVANEIVVSAILGDGRSSGNPDYRTFDGTRGLFSMANDIKNAGSDAFAGAVATAINYSASDDGYAKIVKAISAVNGDRKVAVVKKGFIADVLLAKNTAGAYIFAPGTNLEQLLGVRIIELPEMDGADFDVIAYAEGTYTLFGNQEFVRSRFDDTYNQDVMLVERAVAGSATGAKTVAGYFSASYSA